MTRYWGGGGHKTLSFTNSLSFLKYWGRGARAPPPCSAVPVQLGYKGIKDCQLYFRNETIYDKSILNFQPCVSYKGFIVVITNTA